MNELRTPAAMSDSIYDQQKVIVETLSLAGLNISGATLMAMIVLGVTNMLQVVGSDITKQFLDSTLEQLIARPPKDFESIELKKPSVV